MHSVFSFSLALVAASLVAGCSTPPNNTGSYRLASIIVEHRAADEVEASVLRVFEGRAFKLSKHEDDMMVFEKPGTVMNGLAYGDWYGGGVWERVNVFQREIEPERILVDCDAFMVQEPEDPFFQRVKPVFKSRRSHYQELLDAVAQDLRAHPTAPGAN